MNSYPRHQAVKLAGCEVWLLADRALWWPAQRCLLVADVHFGKAAAFRRLGQPVPQGTTTDNLQRLDALLERLDCRELIFLGDFLHARHGRAPGTLQLLAEWRARHADLALTLVRGNHDRHAGDPPAGLHMQVVGEPLLRGPFALQHEPQPTPGYHVLAGHLHPAYRLRGRGRQSLRLPCFVLGEEVSLLPAFGSFTGAMEIRRQPGQRIFVIGDGGIWPLG